VEIKDIFCINRHLKYRLDIEFTACWRSWCHRKRWRHLPFLSLVCGSGI